MELVLAAIGVAIAFAMILASSKRSRRAPPPRGDREDAADRSRHKNEGGDGGKIGKESSDGD
jgi:hypothetical protein